MTGTTSLRHPARKREILTSSESSKIIAPTVFNPVAEFVELTEDQTCSADNEKSSAEAVIPVRILPNQAEEVFQTMVPQPRKRPGCLSIDDEQNQTETGIQNMVPLRSFCKGHCSSRDGLKLWDTP
jgi:hypothetical protein